MTAKKSVNDYWIEVLAFTLDDDFHGLGMGERFLVWSKRTQGILDIHK
jgi:hypothetical protein